MALPSLDIEFTNGNIDTVVPSEDGIFGLLCSAVAVPDSFELGAAYPIKGMQDVADMGIMPDLDNTVLYKKLSNFYAEAGEGTKLWLMGFDKSDKPSDWFTADPESGIAPAQKLLDKSNGEISMLFTGFDPDESYSETIENGVDSDVPVALNKAQSFAEDYLSEKFTPISIVLEAYAFDGNAADLADLTEMSNNRVGVFVGDSKKRNGDVTNKSAANEILCGRLAAIQVQENPGKVKLGELDTLEAFIVDEAVESYDIESLHNLGYITFRTHQRKAGYYISDDPLATSQTDDYSNISLRRTIDKAYRIAHNLATEELLNDFDLTPRGTISKIYARSVQGRIEDAIYAQMTLNGELSRNQNDSSDLGVNAQFDTSVNVAVTNELKMALRVRPKGYARYFVIELGYDVSLSN